MYLNILNAKKPAPGKDNKIFEKNGNVSLVSGLKNRIRISTLTMVSYLRISRVFNSTYGVHLN